MDTNMLMWSIRIQETEALLERRKSELQLQQQKRFELQQELLAEEEQQDVVRQELANVKQAAEGLTSSSLQVKQDIAAAREQLIEEQATTGLAAQQRCLQEQLSHLSAMVASEQRVQQQYEDSVANHMQDKGHRARELQDKTEKISCRLDQLKQQEQRLCLEQQLSQLRRQQQLLQEELSQLTDTLTGSKQANVLARAKVAAAVSSTDSELKAAQERLSSMKGKGFEMQRQQVVFETRLRQHQQEGDRLRQQCVGLDQLIHRASATIHQLTSSCDL